MQSADLWTCHLLQQVHRGGRPHPAVKHLSILHPLLDPIQHLRQIYHSLVSLSSILLMAVLPDVVVLLHVLSPKQRLLVTFPKRVSMMKMDQLDVLKLIAVSLLLF